MIIRRRFTSGASGAGGGGMGSAEMLGGRIYHIEPGDNGCTYEFYDANGRLLDEQTEQGLATAVYYVRNGEPTKDKFFVYMTTDGMPGSKNYISAKTERLEWGAHGTKTGVIASGWGNGKVNSQKVLTFAQAFKPCYSKDSTIWAKLKEINDKNTLEHNDWYIPNSTELSAFLKNKTYSGNTDYHYWCSEEHNNNRGCENHGMYIKWCSPNNSIQAVKCDLETGTQVGNDVMRIIMIRSI